jgi:hypothetical protein
MAITAARSMFSAWNLMIRCRAEAALSRAFPHGLAMMFCSGNDRAVFRVSRQTYADAAKNSGVDFSARTPIPYAQAYRTASSLDVAN